MVGRPRKQGASTSPIKPAHVFYWKPVVTLLVVAISIAIQFFLVTVERMLPVQKDASIDFQKWFKDHGGSMAESIQLVSFESFGHGLLATGPGSEKDVIVPKGQQILGIPASLQFSAATARSKFHKICPSTTAGIQQTINAHFLQQPLEQQDVWIALDLMLESAKGQTSLHAPYLSLLPLDVPRLDTFDERELELLQDGDLVQLARESRRNLQQCWESTLSNAMETIVRKAGLALDTDASLLTFASFHRFVAIAGSHAMILLNDNGDTESKYLVPMADMINHAPVPADDDDSTLGESESFSTFHSFDKASGAITVMADRNFKAGDQIFEQYGALDNSLFLVAFGFVPRDNPSHCALLPVLPPVGDARLREVLLQLGVGPLESVCARKDGSLLEEDYGNAYLSIVALEEGGMKEQLERCLEASQNDRLKECMEYPNASKATRPILRKGAVTALSSSKTSLERDVALLEEMKQSPRGEDDDSTEHQIDSLRAELSLRFRIEEKKILKHLSSYQVV